MTDLTKEDIESTVKELESERVRSEMLAIENSEITEEHSKLQNDFEILQKENYELKKTLRTNCSGSEQCYTEDSLQDQDEKVKYLTGLPRFSYLIQMFHLVFPRPHTENSQYSLSLFQQLLIALMKLRLNLGDQDLAYRFGVHQSTISRCVSRVIDVMYIRLKPLVTWPQREQLMATMPMEFRKHFKTCVIILDCFEVFCDRPTNVKARAQTWSNYKHHNTVKFLIGIAPQGAVTFISKGWGGRVSDVHLTENCGLLDNLCNGDTILADRGFTIHNAAGVYCAEVKLPPFTRGKPQLAKREVDFARQLSRVRIHVGLIRQKYTILESTIPINLIMTNPERSGKLDKIVFICCALCNCCPPVVSCE